jgi:uncharacterized membrane protein YfcA
VSLFVLAAALFVASFARGYSGFGFSALLVSGGSLVADPARLVVLALLLEVLASVLQARSVWVLVDWRRVGLLMAGAALGTPFGTWLLVHAPVDHMKAGIAVFVLLAAAILLAGFNLKTKIKGFGTAMLGAFSGVANGATGMGGLPLVLFFTAQGDEPARMRATLIAYFFLLDLLGLAFLAAQGLVAQENFHDAVAALPLLLLGMWLGARHFLGATPESFRRSTLWLLVVLGLLGVGKALY